MSAPVTPGPALACSLHWPLAWSHRRQGPRWAPGTVTCDSTSGHVTRCQDSPRHIVSPPDSLGQLGSPGLSRCRGPRTASLEVRVWEGWCQDAGSYQHGWCPQMTWPSMLNSNSPQHHWRLFLPQSADEFLINKHFVTLLIVLVIINQTSANNSLTNITRKTCTLGSVPYNIFYREKFFFYNRKNFLPKKDILTDI